VRSYSRVEERVKDNSRSFKVGGVQMRWVAFLCFFSFSTTAFGLVVAFTTPAFARDTEADCQKAGGTWDAKTKTCTNKY
jgi:hypothetical protein